jgi:hypothetical protein
MRSALALSTVLLALPVSPAVAAPSTYSGQASIASLTTPNGFLADFLVNAPVVGDLIIFSVTFDAATLGPQFSAGGASDAQGRRWALNLFFYGFNGGLPNLDAPSSLPDLGDFAVGGLGYRSFRPDGQAAS